MYYTYMVTCFWMSRHESLLPVSSGTRSLAPSVTGRSCCSLNRRSTTELSAQWHPMGWNAGQRQRDTIRLRWYGHVVRTDVQSVMRQALALSPDGQQLQGWLRKWWMDCLHEDMQAIGLQPTLQIGQSGGWNTNHGPCDMKIL